MVRVPSPCSILHILPTLLLHATLLRDMERHLGWLKITIIYVGSGIFGNLLSAIVTPYYPTVSCHTKKHSREAQAYIAFALSAPPPAL